ncbi:hypothetical protein GCM10010869_09540 [Mesorhizobium tianshanense]|uniref:Uncharacterized protein n=1 Tax=Mesorhizobium tianshanense TaxID=39844 RepID=A0A562NLI1_9HYPH|nr:hypothetical protein [Mesorhizobium tianshanense]TWI33044.1 hypothetical protein IQ26_04253 [Mesorhizobium tianshanense]GLS35366.1 hypothetical protein GCM10010869_09540 [Mesorhizobium tianshanense]
MRAGDIIKSKRGHRWIVGYAVEDGVYECLGSGRHLFLVRDNGTELLMTLRPECDLKKGYQRNDFEVGYSSARYGSDSSVTLSKENALYFAVPAPLPTHPFVETTIDGKMLAKAPSALAELFVSVQRDFDDGHSEHLTMWRWQFALLIERDRQGKPPIDFTLCEGRIALPEEV